ncbi:hypothetical protein C8N25_1396 [Algoriphagus antarcticus]|uniref:Uncharacterized protein n=1 Tax=Algoriphagus antarcticus TaxID=238540 RepID=A0A3E0D6N0_9BACT|nr:hypothetical protein C8N25_1396 [Algoriphagus antarcticus]
MQMDREGVIKNVLLQTLLIEETEKHLSYLLSNNELEFIKNTAIDVLKNMPPKAFNCTQLHSDICNLGSNYPRSFYYTCFGYLWRSSIPR